MSTPAIILAAVCVLAPPILAVVTTVVESNYVEHHRDYYVQGVPRGWKVFLLTMCVPCLVGYIWLGMEESPFHDSLTYWLLCGMVIGGSILWILLIAGNDRNRYSYRG